MAVQYLDHGIGRLEIKVVGLKPGQKMYCQAFPGDNGNAFKSAICQLDRAAREPFKERVRGGETETLDAKASE
eukprot:COSAG04_NODE_17352_length_471_cov_1.865591_1_plen_73_part_00